LFPQAQNLLSKNHSVEHDEKSKKKHTKTYPESRNEAGSREKEIQSHTILEMKEKPCDRCDEHNDSVNNAQAVLTQHKKAFSQSEELRSGFQSEMIPKWCHQLTSLSTNQRKMPSLTQ